jgi:hypothetical protein
VTHDLLHLCKTVAVLFTILPSEETTDSQVESLKFKMPGGIFVAIVLFDSLFIAQNKIEN